MSVWQDRAACKGVPAEVFYPSPKARSVEAFAEALSYCAGCPVRAECAEAGQTEPDGVWGGVPWFQRVGRVMSTKCGRGVRSADGHGTEAGYVKHRRNGEPPCEACQDAARRQWREREARRRLKAAS